MNTDNLQVKQVQQAINNVLTDMRHRPIPIGISNHHLHVSQADYDQLFPGQPMTQRKALKQPGQFAAEQTVTLIGPKGKLEKVRILGPVRSETQVELSKTDARHLGIAAPLRLSGHTESTPGIIIASEHAQITVDHGVIVALRHIHMSPLDALIYDVKQGDEVEVAIEGTARNTRFAEVMIRVSPQMELELHLDTDEANAADLDNPHAYARIVEA